MRSVTNTEPRVHWLLPIDPAAHPEHLPADWRTDPDATEVWRAIAMTQPIERWCLRSGYRSMLPGDTIWAYLSRRQQLCAVGTVREVMAEAPDRAVLVDWDDRRTARLARSPVSRSEFGQVPMSTCRARPEVCDLLERTYRDLERP